MLINLSEGKIRLNSDNSTEISEYDYWLVFTNLIDMTNGGMLTVNEIKMLAYIFSLPIDTVLFNTKQTAYFKDEILGDSCRGHLTNVVYKAKKGLIEKGFIVKLEDSCEYHGEYKLNEQLKAIQKQCKEQFEKGNVALLLNFKVND